MLNYAWHHLAMRCIAFVTNIGHTHQVNRVHDVVFSIGGQHLCAALKATAKRGVNIPVTTGNKQLSLIDASTSWLHW